MKKTMRIPKIISYIIYVVVLSSIHSFLTVLQEAAIARSNGYPTYPVFSGSLRYVQNVIPYVICQIVAAAITIKPLSLNKLFFLSCVFTIISELISFIGLRDIKTISQWYFVFFPVGQLLPYIAPVLILALIQRKKAVSKPASGLDIEAASAYIESGEKAESKIKLLYKRYWYVFDIILIISILLYGTLIDPFGLITYVCGLYNKMIISVFLFFIWIFLLVPASLCLLVLILRMFISWNKYIRKKIILFVMRLFIIVGLSGYLIIPFTSMMPHGFNIYIKGFSKYVKVNADIEDIRAWLGTLSTEDCIDYDVFISGSDGSERKRPRPKHFKKEYWPKDIIILDPGFVELSLDDDSKPKVRLAWGSGFLGSWGFVVGNENMPTPASDLSLHGEYRQEIRKGVYVWYEIE